MLTRDLTDLSATLEPSCLISPAAEHHRTLAGTHFPSHVGYEAELAWVDGCIPRLFASPKTVTHPGTNRTRRRVTSLIRPTPLPLRHANKKYVDNTKQCTLKAPFTRYILLSNRLSNRFDNRQTGCTTGLTTGCTSYNRFDNRLYRVNGVLAVNGRMGMLLFIEQSVRFDERFRLHFRSPDNVT